MFYFTILLVVVALAAIGYYKRYGFRRAWYILRTGAEKPDWRKLDAEYFLEEKYRK